MSSGKKTEHGDRTHGGPGSSHQDASDPRKPAAHAEPALGEPTNPSQSKVSGGGGERDSHHTHDPRTK
jgi:hypothetical protein